MFGKSKQSVKELESKVDSLQEQKRELEDELSRLKTKKKCEEEDIKHMVKLKEERQAVEFQKKELQMERDKETAIAEVKDQYRDKLEARLEKEVQQIKEMYGQILERLPNVNVRMKGDV